MNAHKIAWIFVASFAFAAVGAEPEPKTAPVTAAGLAAGEIRPLACNAKGTITCRVYAPANFDAKRRYPVLFGFSPDDGQAENSAKRWKAFADRFGWVVAWCDQGVPDPVKADEWKPRCEAILTMLEKQMRVHPARCYATGCKSGAHAAMAMARLFPARFAGVIAESATEPESPQEHPAHLAVLVTTPRVNPQGMEIAKTQKACAGKKIPFRLELFSAKEPEPAPGHAIEPGLVWLDKLWWQRPHDKSPETLAERAAMAAQWTAEVKQLLADRELPSAYDRAIEIRETFGKSPELDAILADLEKNPAVVGLKAYKPPKPADVAAAFLKACRENKYLNDAARDRIEKRLGDAANDHSALAEAMVESLGEMYPPFAKAVAAVNEEKPLEAIAALRALDAKNDPFLAAHAAYFLGWALVQQEQYEAALAPLSEAAGPKIDRSLYGGESLFLLGLCQSHLQQRKAAVRILDDFLKFYPEASERMRVGADNVARLAQAVADGSLPDVQDRMDDCRRRLKLENSGKPTQQKQDKVVSMLERLIQEAEDRENSGSGGGGGPGGGQGGPPSGNQRPGSPANQSQIGPGEGNVGNLNRTVRGKPEEVWGNARQRDREKVLNVLKSKFPDRYRELLEQYYKSLQEGQR